MRHYLTTFQLNLLGHIHQCGPCSVVDVYKGLEIQDVSLTTVRTTLDRLVKAGYLNRKMVRATRGMGGSYSVTEGGLEKVQGLMGPGKVLFVD
jgi:predicted transcriptional regulator